MRIAVDFDQTITRDPALFAMWVSAAVIRGHTVCVVTARQDTPEDRQTVAEFVPREVRTYYTGGAMKRWYMETERGLKVDIWVDDDPASIGRG